MNWNTTKLLDDILCGSILQVLSDCDLDIHVSRYVTTRLQWNVKRHSSVSLCLYISLYRPNWISMYGQEFYRGEFVLHKFQDNDLPQFGRIKDILVLSTTPLLAIEEYRTQGINNHLMSYCISRTNSKIVVLLSSLEEKQSYSSHIYQGDEEMYIALKSHVIYVNATI